MTNEQTIESLVSQRNDSKLIFTAGPASLLPENLAGLRPCFGRGDDDYLRVEEDVLVRLKAMSGHSQIARMQGSASLALEIMVANFLHGRLLVVETGYYSERLHALSASAQQRDGRITDITTIDWTDLNTISGRYDWVLACSTETSRGLRLPIHELSHAAKTVNAKLALDATASIGLEEGHDEADVLAYSSCKGLFGLTGACFVAFNELPGYEVDSFYLNLRSHLEKRMTGPYHAIASLFHVLPKHDTFRSAVKANKAAFMQAMSVHLTVPPGRQPLLCTHVDCHITSDDPRAVLYKPRSSLPGSVVCHLGEVHLAGKASGAILESLRMGE